jgi:RNA polymerase sigma factor (sigma-70 family)
MRAISVRGGCILGEMTIENSELLRRYVADRSEPAFTSLVERHIDLVYSAALRQVGGDVPAAEDVTQAVFCDLARHARRLTRHPSLTGWLYTSTRFQAAKVRRTEQRRRAREQEAHAMNHLLAEENPDPTWLELRPVLDDAMHDLNATDRDAVLMRYFEERPMAEIGARFGITENAARMRVDRAVEKLRAALAKRGVSSTAAVLMAGLTQYAVGAAPGGLALQASQAALAGGAGAGGLLGGVQAFLAAGKVPLGVGCVAATVLVVGLWLGSENLSPEVEVFSADTEHVIAGMEQVPASSTSSAPGSAGEGLLARATAGTGLQLDIVTADTGQPVPNARIEYWRWEGTASARLNLTANRFGQCSVPVPRGTTTQLILVSQCDGFADTRLAWRPDRGEVIPEQYTLRVARSVPIGGMVVDAEGQPVAGAEVGFNTRVDAGLETYPESDNFSWPFWVTAETDAEGRWRIDRIGEAALRTIHGSATHSEHVRSDPGVSASQDLEAVSRLIAGTHVFRLGRGVVAQGVVLDGARQLVSGAKVTVGYMGEVNRREAITGADGTFRLVGCKPGATLLTAEASGFAATTMEIDLTESSDPFEVTLSPGQLLRLRVVDANGIPVPGARVTLDTLAHFAVDLRGQQPSPVQTRFHRQTDMDGRVEWHEAPDRELNFHISAPGYMREDGFRVIPDGVEHEIVLESALTISGTVTDERSGELIPRFRIITGLPEPDIGGSRRMMWSSIDRFWLNFEGGRFHHVFEEPAVSGTREPPRFIFKIEAEGYAPVVTRVVQAHEGEARFDVRMRSATATAVTVLLPDGRPAADADIGLVAPGSRLRLIAGGFSREGGSTSGGSLLVCDQDGQFRLSPDEAVLQVIAAHPEGFAETTPDLLRMDPVLRLEPWGRLEGTYLSGGKAAADRELRVQYGSGDFDMISTDFSTFRVKTDRDGAFAFPRVPPGRHSLVRLLVEPHGNSTGGQIWTHSSLGSVEIAPGETTTVVIGAAVYTVTARLEWPEGVRREDHWEVRAWLTTPVPPVPPDVQEDRALLAAWFRQPEVRAAVANRQHFQLSESMDGIWVAEDVPPGEYRLGVSAFESTEAGGQLIMHAQVSDIPVSVPDDPPTGILDLGLIPLEAGR